MDQKFLLFYCWDVLHCKDVLQFIEFFLHKHIDCFQYFWLFWIKLPEHLCIRFYVDISFQCAIAGLCGNCMLYFIKKLSRVFQSGCPFSLLMKSNQTKPNHGYTENWIWCLNLVKYTMQFLRGPIWAMLCLVLLFTFILGVPVFLSTKRFEVSEIVEVALFVFLFLFFF